MSIAVLQQIKVTQLLSVASALGYSHKQAWLKVILPQWASGDAAALSFAVAAYGCSVV